jgi:hypothetical protein
VMFAVEFTGGRSPARCPRALFRACHGFHQSMSAFAAIGNRSIP